MNKLNLYLIKDLFNIVIFYTKLRTINYKSLTSFQVMSLELDGFTKQDFVSCHINIFTKDKSYKYIVYNFHQKIKHVYWEYFDEDKTYFIGLLKTDNFYFYCSYKDYHQRKSDVLVSISKSITSLIDFFLDKDSKNKFYEFQNEYNPTKFIS
jgi:hypothetical protein